MTSPQYVLRYSSAYELAGGDPIKIPWARQAPNPLLSQWLAEREGLEGKRALDVGCGLGDNAEALAAAGAAVTAFDCAARAVEWARERFPKSQVEYGVADLLHAPGNWRGAFDLVHECYTLQGLPEQFFDEAARALASLVAPGGKMLVVTTARDEGEAVTTRWRPLTYADMQSLAIDGLSISYIEDIAPHSCSPRHWRALYRREE
jgi:2-polyprenyl-3-methyl-5-hydroxy-6-metoxy-1,4-benzoquinol methylase